MSQRSVRIVKDSTNIIELVGLKDTVTGEYLEDAVVTVALLDASGDPVDGADAIALGYVAGTVGSKVTYRGSLPHTLVLDPAVRYTAKVVATAADASVRTIPVPASVVELP